MAPTMPTSAILLVTYPAAATKDMHTVAERSGRSFDVAHPGPLPGPRQAKPQSAHSYITAGDPHPSLTVDLMRGLVEAGADIDRARRAVLDPMADAR